MVEVRGRNLRFFRIGPDYAFITHWTSESRGMRGVLASLMLRVSAHPYDRRISESLQGRMSLPPPTPRRCHGPSRRAVGFTD